MATEEDQMASAENEMASEEDNMTSEKDNHLTCEDDNLTSEKDDHPRRRKRRGKAPAWHDDLGDREAMERAVSWNGYWALPENVLVALFHDDDIKVRERACKIVLELQQSQAVKEQQQSDEEGKLTVREFQAPHISLSVERNSYTDFLAHVPKEDWTCPPLFLGVAEDVLRAGVAGGRSKDVFDFVGFPNNPRCVERAVQATTLASAICQKEETREEILALGDYSREIMKVFRKKAHWVPHNV